VNQSEVDERLEVSKADEPLPGLAQEGLTQDLTAEMIEETPAPLASPPSWLRLAYTFEFLIALIAIISLWSEIGGEGHLDLMPWYTKLVCVLGLAWCCVRFTASIVEQQEFWTRRTIIWFASILLFGVAMGAITYYYHLHEQPDEGDEDTTTAAVSITAPGSL
jgi:hypothetical protein